MSTHNDIIIVHCVVHWQCKTALTSCLVHVRVCFSTVVRFTKGYGICKTVELTQTVHCLDSSVHLVGFYVLYLCQMCLLTCWTMQSPLT